ncbi:hypothetical protein JCM33374_g5321 [Metschnikowia sp. JCM 33374]|nr:hypothetical protein JCM33374_g5321 [Metschnikowia sp. JCM 33374]
MQNIWLSRYLNRTSNLTGFLNRTLNLAGNICRPHGYIRASSETSEKSNDWFNRVEDTTMEFGIKHHDVYNVDKTGFAMRILSQVITGSDCHEDPRIIQSGYLECVTAMGFIRVVGFMILPFII